MDEPAVVRVVGQDGGTDVELDAPRRVLTVQTYGEVFTRRWVVEMMLDLAGYTPDRSLFQMTAVEPSVGSGAFIGPLVQRLAASKPAEVPWADLANCVRAHDIVPDHVTSSRAVVESILVSAGCPLADAADLAATWIRIGDFLLSTKPDLLSGGEVIEADLVVGNPPYIRIEDIPADLLARYRRVAPTMGGRADIFVGFYEHGLDLLKPGGRLAFICADRWMRNSYGRALRHKVVSGGFAVDDVLVMHDAPAFEEEVSAYPAITVLRRGPEQKTVSATATAAFTEETASTFLDWRRSEARAMTCSAFRAAKMDAWHQTSEVWPEGSPETLAWLAQLTATFPVLEWTGMTRIGIGIATGSDAVFIPKSAPAVEPEQLVPMVMPDDVRGEEFHWSGRHLISPWNSHGPVELSTVPKLAAYYARHSATLHRRNVASRSAYWYRTIDRLNASLLTQDILVMQDMKAHSHPVRVPAGYYPHHNLTWLTSTEWDLDALGGMLMSEIVERQVAAYCVKMRGGTLRFQPTVLRKVRVPSPATLAPDLLDRLAAAFRTRDRSLATAAALDAIGQSSLPG